MDGGRLTSQGIEKLDSLFEQPIEVLSEGLHVIVHLFCLFEQTSVLMLPLIPQLQMVERKIKSGTGLTP